MIKIQVINCNGASPDQPLFAEFDEMGGNIGRAAESTLVLLDPDRHISRTHAAITFIDGDFFIRSLGSALPIYLNNTELNHNENRVLAINDKIGIGNYVMQVSDESANTISSASQVTITKDPVQAENPFSNPSPTIEQDSSKNTASQENIVKEIIPSNFNPFPELPSEQNKADLESNFSAHSENNVLPNSNIDKLVNQKDTLKQPYTENRIDPLDAANKILEPKKPTDSVSIQRDDTPAIHSAYYPPPQPTDHDNEVSIMTNQNCETIDEPSTTNDFTNQEELLQAFINGAGISSSDKPIQLTPQLMTLIGQLLRESTQGTLDLLNARAHTRREMGAELTMISEQENNPLKHSPSVEIALTHLLNIAQKEPGFLPPKQALKEAYDDLRAHQFGFMAGMRAALMNLLTRFSPNKLEQRFIDEDRLHSSFPIFRKAKLWTLFIRHYDKISSEAEEDSQTYFGDDFLHAYEEQIAKLKRKE